MDIQVTFPGGMRVDAQFNGHTIHTDQAREAGGEGSAPEPYALFLASIATCAGIYSLRFCQNRNLPTEGLRVTQSAEWDEKTHRLTKVVLTIHTPAGFPEKYREALVRAADQCAVKRTILAPPEFEVRAVSPPA